MRRITRLHVGLPITAGLLLVSAACGSAGESTDRTATEGSSAETPAGSTTTASTEPSTTMTDEAERGGSLRFHGTGSDDIDRVKIAIDDPGDPADGPIAADIGETDLTIEFWLKGRAEDNDTRARPCGTNENWIYGNIVLDRDRWSADRKFGVSIVDGRLMVGVRAEEPLTVTACSTSVIVDGTWHHVAIQRHRSDGRLQIWIDGALEADVDGPDGDLSHPDDAEPREPNDPFLVIGAEKHDVGSSYPSFTGNLDELRFSDVLRYDDDFEPPSEPFETDGATRLLLHFDDGEGERATDSSDHPDGPGHGELRIGGPADGPTWSRDTPFG